MQRALALNCSSRPARADSGIGPLTLHGLTDEAIARLAESGSERAFAALYERYHGRLHAYCYLLLQDEEDAYDALQSTLARALDGLRGGGRDRPLGRWLFRLADVEATLLIRARATAAANLWQGSGASEPFRSADDSAEQRARLSLLLADLRELPDLQRRALLMRELSGLSHEEIAVALEISSHGARQAIFHARRSLAEFQEGRSQTCDEVRRTISGDDGRSFRRRSVRAHLRDCGPCSAFAAAIPQRRADLHALAPPLAPALAGGLLLQLTRGGYGHAATSVSAGAAKAVGTSLAAKALTVAAIVVSTGAAVGTASAIRLHAGHPAGAPLASSPALPAFAPHQLDARAVGARRYERHRGRLRARIGPIEGARAADLGADPSGVGSTNPASDGAGALGATGMAYSAAAPDPVGASAEASPAAGGDPDRGREGSVDQPLQPTVARGKSGGPPPPRAHGPGVPSPPPGAVHAPVEPGAAAHQHGAGEAPSGKANSPEPEAHAPTSMAPGPTSPAPAGEPGAPAPESVPQSAPAGDPGNGGKGDPASPETAAGAGSS